MIDFGIYSELGKSEIIGLNKCFSPIERTYERGETITICSSKNDTIGIIKSGVAYLLTINTEEQRRILDYYQEGDIFGIHFIPEHENKAFYVIAKTKCTVDFIRYSKFITCCHNHCEKHIKVIDNIIMSSIKKHMTHIDILAQRSLRSKLMSFFEYLRAQKGKNTFTLPLTLSDLADYLAVDRSAMMREIKKLNDEKIIKSEKHKITLL